MDLTYICIDDYLCLYKTSTNLSTDSNKSYYSFSYIEYVPVERVQERVEYQAVERSIAHPPVQQAPVQVVQQAPVQVVQQAPVQYVQQAPVQYVQQQPLVQSVVRTAPAPVSYAPYRPLTTSVAPLGAYPAYPAYPSYLPPTQAPAPASNENTNNNATN